MKVFFFVLMLCGKGVAVQQIHIEENQTKVMMFYNHQVIERAREMGVIEIPVTGKVCT